MSSSGISIVIVSYNTKDLVKKCLASVMANMDSVRGDDVCVVDNASQDGTPAMLEESYPGVRVIRNKTNKGFSFACNVGYQNTKGKYVLYVNGDVQLPAGSLNQLYKKIEAFPRLGILSPELVREDGVLVQMTRVWNMSLFWEVIQKIFSPHHIQKSLLIRKMVGWFQRKERDVPIVAGACLLVRRDLLDQLKGFDENYELYFEDADLCVRCWKAGYTVRMTPDIKVFHALGQSSKKEPTKISLVYRQSQIYFYRKHNSAVQTLFLKIYLWIKFVTSRLFWKDRYFRHWIRQIIAEKERFTLTTERSIS